MKFKYLLMGLVVAVGIGAYPMLATFMALADVGESRLPSVVLRFSIVALALVTLWFNASQIRIYNLLFSSALGVFWSAYLLRIISDGFISQDMSQLYNPTEVLATALTFVVIPMLPGLVGLNDKSNRLAYVFLFALTGIAVAMLMMQSTDIILAFRQLEGVRFSLEKLNPISVGYVGATMIMLCAVGVFRLRGALSFAPLAVYAIGGASGLYILMIAASKGPVAALLVAMLFYWLVPIRPSRLLVGGVLLTGVAAIVFRMKGYLLRKFDFDVSVRFLQAAEGETSSIDERLVAIGGAWRQFVESPLLGDAMFVKITGGYPHNLLLEAMMTTGVIGTLAYLICVGFMFVAAIRLLYRESGYEWLALLAIFFFVAAQFSGAHFSFGAHWLTLVAVVATSYASRDSRAMDGYASEAYQSHNRRRRRRKRYVSRPSL